MKKAITLFCSSIILSICSAQIGYIGKTVSVNTSFGLAGGLLDIAPIEYWNGKKFKNKWHLFTYKFSAGAEWVVTNNVELEFSYSHARLKIGLSKSWYNGDFVPHINLPEPAPNNLLSHRLDILSNVYERANSFEFCAKLYRHDASLAPLGSYLKVGFGFTHLSLPKKMQQFKFSNNTAEENTWVNNQIRTTYAEDFTKIYPRIITGWGNGKMIAPNLIFCLEMNLNFALGPYCMDLSSDLEYSQTIKSMMFKGLLRDLFDYRIGLKYVLF